MRAGPALLALALFCAPFGLQPAFSQADTTVSYDQQIETLRNEALEHMGWVSGNTRDVAAWYYVRGRIGPGSKLLTFLVEGDGRSAHEARYAVAAVMGERLPFDEAEAGRRMDRISAIFKELLALKEANK